MKKIKSIIVLLFVLFTIPTIAQTTYTIGPGCNSTTHFDVKKTTQTSTDGFVDETTTTIGHKNTLDQIITLISQDVSTNSYSNYSLIFSGNLDFSGQNLTGITPTLTTINGTLTVGTVNIGSITVNGTLNMPEHDLIITDLTVNGNVYTNRLTNNGTISVNNYKVLKVKETYTDNGTEDFSSNSIIIGIDKEYTKRLSARQRAWNFIGFPDNRNLTIFTEDGMPEDVWAIEFNYTNNAWNTDNYLLANDVVSRGKGIFVFPDGDISKYITITSKNEDVETLNYTGSTSFENQWFALANPFTYNLSIEKFVDINSVQGGCIYKYNGTSFDIHNGLTVGTIAPFEGFFVNLFDDNLNINFKLDELFYASQTNKSEVEEQVNYIDIDVLTDDYAVPVTFLHKETALAEYDIFDADKMFGSGAVAEPYFVLGERNLCIEAVNTLPYTAPMNIKSGEARNVQIVVSHIPEQYEVTLVDGEEEIALEAGVAYETMIASGENSDRFKVIINKKNSVSISDVENVSEISLRQYNRNIIIEGGKNIYTEIFNMLGQKVYETADRNFMLNKVDAGAYVVKVKDGNSVSTTKIVVK